MNDLEPTTCEDCWNGNGNGDWCYFERDEDTEYQDEKQKKCLPKLELRQAKQKNTYRRL